MTNTSVQKFQNIGWEHPLELLGFNKKMVLDNFKEKSVIDIGCGDGFLLKKLLEKNKNIKALGVDISPVAVEKAKENGVECRLLDITERLPFEDNSFESVILLDVLEHMLQPEPVLREAVRVAGEYVYISVPNFVSLPARIQVLLGRVPENNTVRKGHIFWTTRQVIHLLIKKCGLKVEKEVITTFWEDKPIQGTVMKILAKIRPEIFALAFAIKAKKLR